MDANLAVMIDEILAEQFMDSYEKAAIVAGRLPCAGGRRQPAPCQPEEMLISSADDPEHPDREQGLQSLLLDVGSPSVTAELHAALSECDDWEGMELLKDLAHPDQDHMWLWECAPRARRPSRARKSEKLFF